MTTGSLNLAIKGVLEQGCMFLRQLDGETFSRPLHGVFTASLGTHYRHVLDHFFCLAEGIHMGHINYDQRRRNPQLEHSLKYARLVTEGLINELETLSSETLAGECVVTYSVGYEETEAQPVKSNVAREVIFCVGHAIHHYAILKLLCAAEQVQLPYEFGVAPSTLKHVESETVEMLEVAVQA